MAAVPKDEKDEGSMTPGDIKIGSVIPEFTLICVDGQEHKLSDFRGSKVMLCFYSFATCPLCAYSISNLIGNYKKLAWASKLKVITIFRTDVDYLKKGLTEGKAPIPRLTERSLYPFLALADPDGSAGSTFKVEDRGLIGTAIDSGKILGKLVSEYNTCNLFSMFSPMEVVKHFGGATMLPSEFLIDEEGILVDVLRTEKRMESMSMDRITEFLLFGARRVSAIRRTPNEKRGRRATTDC
jgi:peroxiredoxin